MRFPNVDILWECILIPYLELKDIAIFDLAINNHFDRLCIYLGSVYDINQSNRYLSLRNPNYYPINLTSNYMKLWCDKRHLNLYHINLRYDIAYNIVDIISGHDTSTEVISDICIPWDILNYIEKLTLFVSILNISNILKKMNSLTDLKFCDHVPIRDENVDDIITRYSCSNGNYTLSSLNDRGQKLLLSLSIDTRFISFNNYGTLKLGKLITNLSSIQSISLSDGTTLRPIHIKLIAENWKYLHSFELKNSRILKDEDFQIFYNLKRSFREIKLSQCPLISVDGIGLLLSHSQKSLTLLHLHQDQITINDVKTILSKVKELQTFYIRLPDIKNELFLYIGSYCRKLKHINMKSNIKPISEISSDYIEFLTCRCPLLESIDFGGIFLPENSINIIIEAYNQTLKCIRLSNIKTQDYLSLEKFALCKHRVDVNGRLNYVYL